MCQNSVAPDNATFPNVVQFGPLLNLRVANVNDCFVRPIFGRPSASFHSRNYPWSSRVVSLCLF